MAVITIAKELNLFLIIETPKIVILIFVSLQIHILDHFLHSGSCPVARTHSYIGSAFVSLNSGTKIEIDSPQIFLKAYREIEAKISYEHVVQLSEVILFLS